MKVGSFILAILISSGAIPLAGCTLDKDIPSTNHVPLTNVSVPLIATHNSHHVNVYIGSPPQRRLVIVDTGSRYLVLPCKPCARCGKKHFSNTYFDPSISTTDEHNHCRLNECAFISQTHIDSCSSDDLCNFRQQYTEGSMISGFELEDIVWFGTSDLEESTKVYMNTAVPFSFGCETQETGMIAQQFADGIVGLISTGRGTIVDIMYEQGVLSHNAFSLCLTKDGGTLSLGGTALAHRHQEVLQTVPLKSSDYYTVEVKAMFVGEIEIKADAFNYGIGTIIDSGTTDSYLPKQISKEVQAAWTQWSKQPYSNKKQAFTFDQYQMLPDVTIVLSNGYRWVIEPHSYMEPLKSKGSEDLVDTQSGWSGSRYFVNRLYVDEESGAVLGSNAMYGHDIVFDVTMKTMSIARARCM